MFEMTDVDEDGKRSSVVVEFDANEADAWSGYDGPMYRFFEFLKGSGFIFSTNTMIGVQEEDGEFRSAVDDNF
jgi:hypothetical protein